MLLGLVEMLSGLGLLLDSKIKLVCPARP